MCHDHISQEYSLEWKWNKENELDWRRKVIDCPFVPMFTWGKISIRKDPPKLCPYTLEHLMKAQKNVK